MGRTRARTRHVQTELLTKDGTRAKSRRGGKRKNAGRPPKLARAGTPHDTRPKVTRHIPVHVVLRIDAAIGNVRRRDMYKSVRRATLVVAKHPQFQIVHLSLQRTHLHLLVEAEHRQALARGMQAFQISAAKHINRAVTPRGERRRRGKVFCDRYFAELIKSPRQAHRALGYVLNNWRKHREDFGAYAESWFVDPFSSAIGFDGWKEHASIAPWPITYEPLVVAPPHSWLLREGWRKHGPLSCFDVPGARIAAERA